MLIHKLARLLSAIAIITLLAASCSSDTVIETGAEADTGSETGASGNSSDNSEPTAVPEASEPEPTAVPATSAPEPTETPTESGETTGQDQDAPAFDDDDVIVLENRGDAIAYMLGEGFIGSDAECIVDGAYQILGTWDFIDVEPSPAQEEELDTILDVCITVVPGPAAGSAPPGTDAELDALWAACDDGSASACDDLYIEAPLESDYEAFGFSCGGRAIEVCSDVLGDDSGDSASGDVGSPAAGSAPPGTDAELDALWVACDGGSAQACEDLFWQSPSDSDYEAFGLSCGGRTGDELCSDVLDG